jgi:chromosome segregation ATPase
MSSKEQIDFLMLRIAEVVNASEAQKQRVKHLEELIPGLDKKIYDQRIEISDLEEMVGNKIDEINKLRDDIIARKAVTRADNNTIADLRDACQKDEAQIFNLSEALSIKTQQLAAYNAFLKALRDLDCIPIE